MGGLALKTVKTKRCNRSEFDIISNELITKLKEHFTQVGIPLFYNNKDTFGDIDILVSCDNFKGNIRDLIETNFAPKEIFHNGDCWSFDYKETQIDLITTSDRWYQTYLFYMSYNDLGNLLGRIAHTFGLKYGQEGLFYDHTFKENKIGRIYISTDYRKIFDFLDVSYDRYCQGFDNLEDIFKFVTTSKYFNWEKVQLNQLNKINRERNLKRKTYLTFLDWIKDNVSDNNHLYVSDKSQEEYNKIIDEYFPESNFDYEIKKLEYEYCKKLYIKSKLTGKYLITKYNIEGKDIGILLTEYKKFIGEDNYDNFLYENKIEIIRDHFDMFYKHIYLKS